MKKSEDIVWHQATVSRAMRNARLNHQSVLIWFTGLSGSGKSTLAHAVEAQLFKLGCQTFVLDGDNVRHGLCADLSFSTQDRTENIRRVAEVSKLMLEAGVITLTAFISPIAKDREKVRELVGADDFIEIYCDCPIEICECRDVKGLYKKARLGEVKHFTGISSPYEAPSQPDLALKTGEISLEACVEQVIVLLLQRQIIQLTSHAHQSHSLK
jgi:adenylylsulfate kinase